ncbi:hypothetical protein ACRCPZ_30450 [Pseudomonas aeruginosa]
MYQIPPLLHRLNVIQKALDYGHPVRIDGYEYIQLDRLYCRMERHQGGAVSIVALAAEHLENRGQLMTAVAAMPHEHWLAVATRTALIDTAKVGAVVEMVFEAQAAHVEALLNGVMIDKYRTKDDEVIDLPSPVRAKVTDPLQFYSDELDVMGQDVQSFDSYWTIESAEIELPAGAWIYGTSHTIAGDLTPPEVLQGEARELSALPSPDQAAEIPPPAAFDFNV